jgi:hypothetical protein
MMTTAEVRRWLPFAALAAVFVAVTLLNFWAQNVAAGERARVNNFDPQPLAQAIMVLKMKLDQQDGALRELFQTQEECRCAGAAPK